MKNIIIILLLLVIGYLGYTQYSSKKDPQIFVQDGMTKYEGSKFSFSYPKKYTLTETSEGVTITSIPIPTVDTAKCQALEDEQARSDCFRPANNLSPNITIKFLSGDANKLWDNVLFGNSYPEQYKKSVYDQVEEVRLGSPLQSYKYYRQADEYGGYGRYGLYIKNGLLLATYTHADSPGGVMFDFLKSNEYQIDKNQQKELVEQILSSLTVK